MVDPADDPEFAPYRPPQDGSPAAERCKYEPPGCFEVFGLGLFVALAGLIAFVATCVPLGLPEVLPARPDGGPSARTLVASGVAGLVAAAVVGRLTWSANRRPIHPRRPEEEKPR